jgi:hypothetical protein
MKEITEPRRSLYLYNRCSDRTTKHRKQHKWPGTLEKAHPSGRPAKNTTCVSNCGPTGMNSGDEIKVKVRLEGLGTRLRRK